MGEFRLFLIYSFVYVLRVLHFLLPLFFIILVYTFYVVFLFIFAAALF